MHDKLAVDEGKLIPVLVFCISLDKMQFILY